MNQLQFELFGRVRVALGSEQIHVWLLHPQTGEPLYRKHFSLPLAPRDGRLNLHLTDETGRRQERGQHEWLAKVSVRTLREGLQALVEPRIAAIASKTVLVDGATMRRDAWSVCAPSTAQLLEWASLVRVPNVPFERYSLRTEHVAQVEQELLSIATAPPDRLAELRRPPAEDPQGGFHNPILATRLVNNTRQWGCIMCFSAPDGREWATYTPFGEHRREPTAPLRDALFGHKGVRVLDRIGAYLGARQIRAHDVPGQVSVTRAQAGVIGFLLASALNGAGGSSIAASCQT